MILYLLLVWGISKAQVILEGPLEDYCGKDELPLYNITTCATCASKCGDLMDLRTLHCSCDATCILHDDCCPGFQDDCPAEYDKTRNISSAYTGKLKSSCQRYDEYYAPTKLVTSCPANQEACSVKNSPFDYIPVTDEDTGVHFVNPKCAACNGVTRGKVWETTVYCVNDENSTLTSNVREGNSSEKIMSREKLLDLMSEGKCYLKVDFQFRIKLRTCQNYTTECHDACQNKHLVDACEHGFTQIVNYRFEEDFKNIYCAMCNIPDDGVFCGAKPQTSGSGQYDKFSLALLFDFNPDKISAVGLRQDPDDCNAGTEWLGTDIGCKLIECQPGYELDKNHCVIMLQHITLTLKVHVYFSALDTEFGTLIGTFGNFIASISTRSIAKLINNTFILDKFEISVNSTMEENNVEVFLNMFLSYPQRSLKNFTSDVTDLLNTELLTDKVLKPEIEAWLSNYSSLFVLNLGVSISNESFSTTNSLCTQIKFTNTEYIEYENKSIKISNNGFVEPGKYVKVKSDIYVCKEHVRYSNQTSDSSNQGINTLTGKLTLSLMSISCFCIIIRIILQPIVPAYATFPMKLQVNLCISIFIAFTLFLLSPLLSEFRLPCKIIGILVHWSFLSMFCWTNVISRDIFISFNGFGKRQDHSTDARSLLYNILMAWGIPLSWVITAVVLDYVNINPSFQPQYGTLNCWMNQSWAVLIFFGIPFGVSLLISLCLYIITACNIRKTLADRNKTLKNDRNGSENSVYIKLFILMGITWIFAFIAPYVNHISVWIIFISLNASQGLFIFIAFVCNKNVYVSLKKRYISKGKCSKDAYIQNKHTTSTTLQNLTPQSSPVVTSHRIKRSMTSIETSKD